MSRILLFLALVGTCKALQCMQKQFADKGAVGARVNRCRNLHATHCYLVKNLKTNKIKTGCSQPKLGYCDFYGLAKHADRIRENAGGQKTNAVCATTYFSPKFGKSPGSLQQINKEICCCPKGEDCFNNHMEPAGNKDIYDGLEAFLKDGKNYLKANGDPKMTTPKPVATTGAASILPSGIILFILLSGLLKKEL